MTVEQLIRILQSQDPKDTVIIRESDFDDELVLALYNNKKKGSCVTELTIGELP